MFQFATLSVNVSAGVGARSEQETGGPSASAQSSAKRSDTKTQGMFEFGSDANASAHGNDRGNSASGAPASVSATGIPSFAFDASPLPAIGDSAAGTGGFKFDAPVRDLAAAATKKKGGAEDKPPLFGSTFK